MSMLACQYSQTKRHGDFDLRPFDLENGVPVTCDVGYICANFGLPVLYLGPMYATDRQTDRQTDVNQHHRGAEHNKQHCLEKPR